MNNGSMWLLALNLAKAAHKGQMYGDKAYIYHLTGVRSMYNELFGDLTQEVSAVCYLHDIIEDTNVTAEDLLEMGFPKMVVDAIVLLTKLKSVSKDEYLAAILTNKLATRVKIADSFFNLTESTKSGRLHGIAKYTDNLNKLTKGDYL